MDLVELENLLILVLSPLCFGYHYSEMIAVVGKSKCNLI